MAMTPRTWLAGSVVATLLLVTATWFLLIGPKRAEATETRELTLAAQDANAQLEVRLGQLEQEFLDLPAKEAELAAVRAAMPEDAALPTVIRTLDGYATDTGVTLMSLAPSAPSVLAAEVPAEAAAPAEDTTASAPSAPAPSGPVTVQIPVTTTVLGDYFEVKAFLERLQTGTRAHLVTSVSLTPQTAAPASAGKPATQDGDVTLTITGSVFALRDAADAPTGAAPATPTAATA